MFLKRNLRNCAETGAGKRRVRQPGDRDAVEDVYWENWGKLGYFNAKGVSVPVAVSVFPDELYPAPRNWAERAFPKLIHYNKLAKGGPFAAWEQPKLLSEELRAGFRSLRN